MAKTPKNPRQPKLKSLVRPRKEVEQAKKEQEQIFLDNLFNPEKAGGKVPSWRQRQRDRMEAMAAIDKLRSVVVQRGRLTEEVKSGINEILNDHSNRLKAFLVGISKKRVDSIVALMNDLDRIEDEISSRNLEVLKMPELLALHASITGREKNLVDFISAVASLTLPEQIEDRVDPEELAGRLSDKMGPQAALVPASSRRKVVSILDRLISEAKVVTPKGA